jgi:hypothetical protein
VERVKGIETLIVSLGSILDRRIGQFSSTFQFIRLYPVAWDCSVVSQIVPEAFRWSAVRYRKEMTASPVAKAQLSPTSCLKRRCEDRVFANIDAGFFVKAPRGHGLVHGASS